MEFTEHFSHHMLVTHLLRGGMRRTLCNQRLSRMLVARPQDLRRASRKPDKTYLTRCWECGVVRDSVGPAPRDYDPAIDPPCED